MRLVTICGPTASGKSGLAVELAKRISGEIVSCDSMQLYKGMDIGTATPDENEMRGVRHHLINVCEPSERLSAAQYRQMALPVINDIVSRGKTPILCGGTGLYIDSLTKPLGFSVEGNDEIRDRLTKISLEHDGREKLHSMLEKIDPEAASRLHPNNLRRVIRAIEVYEITKIPLSEHMKTDAQREADFEGGLYAIDRPRDELYKRIDMRVDEMMSKGLLSEVEALLSRGVPADSTAMQAIGYKELLGAIRGEIALCEAVEAIKLNTRHYAKRQLTWFKNDVRVKWLQAGNIAGMAESIKRTEGL